MTKWADFVVSAIKKGSGLANISHVQIHEDLEHGFGSPKLIDKYQLSSKIQKGLTFVTVHKKNENEWAVGELIRTYVKDGEAYIRTDDNKVDGDNLGHMPTVDELDLVFKEIKKEEPKPIPTPKPTPPPEPEPVVETPSPKINPNELLLSMLQNLSSCIMDSHLLKFLIFLHDYTSMANQNHLRCM